MALTSFFIIQVDTHPETAGIVHFRYLSAHCPVAFALMDTTADKQSYLYKIILLFVPDGRQMNQFIVTDIKYVGSKQELANCISHLLLYAENVRVNINAN
ncbi:hypothetical protein RAH57_03660 [Chryseobacterium sp. CKR4-1]|uniref:hypothetical protein n=1 Tax=Chryseobacterium sp. CKR4-1 TaxID=3068896 RepID=UPI0027968DCB|nr:hypothetical protein [Chryseobacterium sp. CKR4-1]MDQ1803067.1 hypothetical protein [Chryseobacterium sp. CKR4-1]